MPAFVGPYLPPGTLNQNDQPELVVDGLVLRPWSAADAPFVVAAYQDPAIQKWHGRFFEIDEAVQWTADQNRLWAEETGASWIVTRDSRAVGRMSFRTLSLAWGEAEIAYWMASEARGQGIAVQAGECVVDWAFGIGLHRLVLNHSIDNPQSCRVAKKLGFQFEGTRRKSVQHLDGWHDMEVHARLNTD